MRAAALKRHKLIDLVVKMEDRLCKEHNKELELLCRREQMCVCALCSQTDPKGHDIVITEKELEGKQLQLASVKANVQREIDRKKVKTSEVLWRRVSQLQGSCNGPHGTGCFH